MPQVQSARLSRTSPPSKIDLPSPLGSSNSLEAMFARLSATSLSEPSRPAKELSLTGPDKSLFSFEDHVKIVAATRNDSSPPPFQGSRGQPPSRAAPSLSDTKSPPNESRYQSQTVEEKLSNIITQDECEAEYLRKASEYIKALPSTSTDNTHIIKAVAKKLSEAYSTNTMDLRPNETVKLRARYALAIVTYVNKVRRNPESMTAEHLKGLLRQCSGDFLQLCANLVKEKYIALDNLEQVTRLCQSVLDVLPKADSEATTTSSNSETTNAASSISVDESSSKASDVPLQGLEAWPTQEKREHGT